MSSCLDKIVIFDVNIVCPLLLFYSINDYVIICMWDKGGKK